MRHAVVILALVGALTPLLAQETDRPTDEKAQKTYKEALEYLHRRMTESAL